MSKRRRVGKMYDSSSQREKTKRSTGLYWKHNTETFKLNDMNKPGFEKKQFSYKHTFVSVTYHWRALLLVFLVQLTFI